MEELDEESRKKIVDNAKGKLKKNVKFLNQAAFN